MGEFDMYRQAGTTPNFTDIARRYGMDRHTVAKYWRAGGQVEDARRCRPSGLDRHRELIEAKAQLPGATKRGVYEYLLDRCYAGEEPPAYNTLTKWMRRNGIECGRAPEGPEPHPRFETAPGEQMQFDWKESLRMADADGEVFEFNVFSATLGYSRLHRFVYSRTRTEDDVMACLLSVMAANGGTARTLVTDNMSSIVSSSASGRRVSARFARFAAAAGFELELARPRSPQTKGKVESSNRFLSRLAVYEGDFSGEEGLVAAIARIEALAWELGFARVVRLSPKEHDAIIGYVSQLTHAIAVSLMLANDDPRLPLFTGDSFRDLTRIAQIDETLWSELFLHNRDALLQQIDRFSAALAQLREQVAAENEAGLKAMFRISSQRRSWLNQPRQPDPS